MIEFIDPEELPFTTDEIFRAGCAFLPEETARLMADHLAGCGPDVVADRAQRRSVWLAAGRPNAERMPLGAWLYPVELLPALSALSPNTAARVARLRQLLDDEDRDPAV
jgi:hypothetical protein